MNWITFLAIVAKEGLPLALDLYDKWDKRDSDVPTADEVAALRTLANKTSQSQMLDALGRAGVDPASELGKRLLGLL